MSEVVLDSVSKTYPGGVPAVRGLSLRIEPGEFVVLVGPSGCGKTTTLRMIAGLEEATSGSVRIAGRDMAGVPPRERDIAMVFQSYALYPHLSVRQNMGFALRMRGAPRDRVREKVEAAATMLGIEGLLDRKPRELSGGQRQRVAVGKAVVREPGVFLYDEPLSNLDARLRAQLRAELKALHQRLKITTVYVTHDQEEAMTLGDRIVVMDAGAARQVGPPMDVYRRPADRFVAGFIGMPPMNFLEGEIVREGGGLVFAEDAWGWRVPIARVPGAPAPGRVVLGVRPQALRQTQDAEAGVELHVRTVEPLGDSLDVVGVTPAGRQVRARLGHHFRGGPGDRVRLTPDADNLHFFDPGPAGGALR